MTFRRPAIAGIAQLSQRLTMRFKRGKTTRLVFEESIIVMRFQFRADGHGDT